MTDADASTRRHHGREEGILLDLEEVKEGSGITEITERV